MSSDLAREQKSSAGAPAVLYFLIVVILAGMYYYAAFVLYANPEKVVSTYYDAYLSGDFKTVAENTSVFRAAQALPQYANLSPAKLLAQRSAIQEDLTLLLEQGPEQGALEGISVEIMPQYTRKGESTAIVVYKVLQNGKEIGMEAATLDKENNRLRIFQTSMVNQQVLGELSKIDMKKLDQQLKDMMAQ